jgi:hypothetical protein
MDNLNQFANWESDPQILEQFFNWIRFESKLKTLKLDIDTNISEIKQEIMPKILVSTVHREIDGKGWRSVTLHGYSSMMTDDDNYYKEKGFVLPENKEWTDISRFFPKTKEWLLKNIPFSKFGRIRLMILEPGGYVSPHIDYPKGNCLAGINIAINHPQDTEYIVNGEKICWTEGDSRLIDIGSVHAIYNNSDEHRVHIIIHSDPIDQWSVGVMQIVCRSYLKELVNS